MRRSVEPAGVAVGVRIVLTEVLELTDVDLAGQRGDVLVVLVARLGLGDADLPELRRHQLDHGEAREVAVELIQPLDGPGRHQASQTPTGNPVLVFQKTAHAFRIEQSERRLEDRADLLARIQDIDRLLFHQLLQPLGQGRFTAADRAQQVEDLLALLQPLCGMAEVADDPLDRRLQAIKFAESGVTFDGPVHEDPAKSRISRCVDQLGLADCGDDPLGRARVHQGVVAAAEKVVLEAQFLLLPMSIDLREGIEDIHVSSSLPVAHHLPSRRFSPSRSPVLMVN